jgi:hypothetical protein
MTSDEYQQSIRELARAATMPEAVAARMDAELQHAFGTARMARETPPRVRRLVALAAAAAVIIAVSAAVWFTRQAVTPGNVTSAVTTGTPAAAGVNGGTTDGPGLKAGAPAAAGPKAGAADPACRLPE